MDAEKVQSYDHKPICILYASSTLSWSRPQYRLPVPALQLKEGRSGEAANNITSESGKDCDSSQINRALMPLLRHVQIQPTIEMAMNQRKDDRPRLKHRNR